MTLSHNLNCKRGFSVCIHSPSLTLVTYSLKTLHDMLICTTQQFGKVHTHVLFPSIRMQKIVERSLKLSANMNGNRHNILCIIWTSAKLRQFFRNADINTIFSEKTYRLPCDKWFAMIPWILLPWRLEHYR